MNYSLLNCRHGRFLTEDSDMISAVLRAYGEWGENSFLLLKPLIPAGGCVVDVGANVGCLSLPFARCVGPEGVVLALEPQRRVFYNLCANLLINELFWVRAIQCLAGEREDAVSLPLGALDRYSRPGINRGGTSFVRALRHEESSHASNESVAIHALDTLLVDLPACHLVKVDVEGAEPMVLRGMAETLRTKRPYLYLECGSEPLHRELMAILAGFDYAVFWHPALHYRPDNYRRCGNFTASKGDMNILCVPQEHLQGEHSSVWQALHPSDDWAGIAALYPGFQF
jgi:FkbM family methyltransferase